ncbi:SigB/SigF/SigG family RNA polymerase sigma factor [Frankia sp. AgPm24]|uniref:RNA polymerase sigma factor SigF n=1 Tax=Frankia sp. AgPm24 TaxID=631128 RepID=UPI00200C45FB|nr:RNA polymerase sigma factor SigF [Frankia sp. AgPm24]MCK9924090.1 SigB/SigF/SigG family RNA polymerase sigma factor [Frankia sp. AgPm24]
MTSTGRTPTPPRTAPDQAGPADPVASLSQRAGTVDEHPDAPLRAALPTAATSGHGGTSHDGASHSVAGHDSGTAVGATAQTAGPDSALGHPATIGGQASGSGTTTGAPTSGGATDAAVTDSDPSAGGNADSTGAAAPSETASATTTGTERTHSPDRALARALFVRLASLPEGDAERAALRDQLVRMHLPLVEYLARRFRNRGEPLDDLVQVATIGLIKSVDRFDPERGVEFSTYATPTIVGEIKRHFRDKGWAIRVPRRLQELKLSLTKATSELSQTLGRSPTVSEIARHLQMTEEEVLEGLESANAYSAVSLDAPDSGDDEAPAVADTLGVQDESLEGVEYRESLKPLLEKLPPREKRILLLRFFGNMTQSQIATELGISQMHVSRLLARTLAQLRRGLLEDS